jgi:hypothetical protein
VSYLKKLNSTYSLTLSSNAPTAEFDLKEILLRIENAFPGISFTTEVGEKRLVPLEVVIDITIKIGVSIASVTFVKILEKLWKELKEKDITPRTQSIDVIQAFAERYLLSNGITDFKIISVRDKGPFVELLFKDKKGFKHFVVITSFDLKLLIYERQGK